MSRYFSKLAQKSSRRWVTGNEPIRPDRMQVTHVPDPAEVFGGGAGRLREVHQEKVIVARNGKTFTGGGHEEGSSFSRVDPGPMATEPNESVSPPDRRSPDSNLPENINDSVAGFAVPGGPEDGAVDNFVYAHVDKQTGTTAEEKTADMAHRVPDRETDRRDNVSPKTVVPERAGTTGHDGKSSGLESIAAARSDQDNPGMPRSDLSATATTISQQEQNRQAATLSQENDPALEEPLDSRIRVHEQPSKGVVEKQLDNPTPGVFASAVEESASRPKKTGTDNPVSIRIGSIRMEIHQAAKPQHPVTPLPPTQARQRPTGKSRRPVNTHLNRYYLRGW